MVCSCNLNVKIINVGGIEAGITCLYDAFAKVKELNLKNESLLKDELLKQIRSFGNYVPQSREEIYKEALLKEYKKYFQL
ncbi:MAG TPA: hypothetical protein VIR55_04010 [Ignavibacteria bacterium]|jgi:hypothetical protein